MQSTLLKIPTGQADFAAMTSLMSQWLIPLLVEEFITEYAADAAKAAQVTKLSKPSKRRKA